MEAFCQLLWRPRPPTLLSEEKIREIRKSLKKYTPGFEMKDRMALTKVSEEILKKRRELMDKFKSYKQKREEEFNQTLAQRSKLRDGRDDLSSEEVEEETIEFFTKEDIITIEE